MTEMIEFIDAGSGLPVYIDPTIIAQVVQPALGQTILGGRNGVHITVRGGVSETMKKLRGKADEQDNGTPLRIRTEPT